MVSTFPRALWTCVFLVCAGALFLSACDAAGDRVARADATSPAAAFVKYGEDHNAAMAYIFDALVAESPSVRQQIVSDSSARDAYVLMKGDAFMTPLGYDMATYDQSGLRQGPAPSYSLNAQHLMDRIASSVERATTAEEVSTLLAAVEADVPTTFLSKHESDAVYTVASIARHSAFYWETNLTDWLDLLDPPLDGGSHLEPACWAGVIAGDIVGGLYGGAAGGPGGAAGGAVIGSASGAIVAAYNGCFGWS